MNAAAAAAAARRRIDGWAGRTMARGAAALVTYYPLNQLRRRRPQNEGGRENQLKSLSLITFIAVTHEWSGNRLIQTTLQRRRRITDDALSAVREATKEGERDCHLQLIRGAMSKAEEEEQQLLQEGEGQKGM